MRSNPRQMNSQPPKEAKWTVQRIKVPFLPRIQANGISPGCGEERRGQSWTSSFCYNCYKGCEYICSATKKSGEYPWCKTGRSGQRTRNHINDNGQKRECKFEYDECETSASFAVEESGFRDS